MEFSAVSIFLFIALRTFIAFFIVCIFLEPLLRRRLSRGWALSVLIGLSVFVAVGFDHLTGLDSLRSQLGFIAYITATAVGAYLSMGLQDKLNIGYGKIIRRV